MKFSENLKTQIENLNKRKEELIPKYAEKIENFENQKQISTPAKKQRQMHKTVYPPFSLFS